MLPYNTKDANVHTSSPTCPHCEKQEPTTFIPRPKNDRTTANGFTLRYHYTASQPGEVVMMNLSITESASRCVTFLLRLLLRP